MRQRLEQEGVAELAAGASPIRRCSSPRQLSRCLTEEVAGDIDDGKTSPFLCMRFKIGLYKNLDSLIAGMHLDAHRRIPKVNFVSATALTSDNRMCHLCSTLTVPFFVG